MFNGYRSALWSLLLLAVAVSQAAGAEKLDSSRGTSSADGNVIWYDLSDVRIEGKGWADTKVPYDRLPAKAETMVRDAVWNLSRQSAGMCARFMTDAPTRTVMRHSAQRLSGW
jgi:hypothetical protein